MTRKIGIIGVPMDLGQDHRGVDMGPSALRVAGLKRGLRNLGCEVEDRGNVEVRAPGSLPQDDSPTRYLQPIAEACAELASRVEGTLKEGRMPLVLGGDHSIAIGTLAGVSSHYREKKQSIGCLWLDAHGDLNTPESSPSGNIHGMPLACSLGIGPRKLTHLLGFSPKVSGRNCTMVGLRSLDPEEKKTVHESGARAFTMRDVDERGIAACMREALEVAGQDTAGYHVSLDMDMLDPREAPGVGTPVRGGATYREAHLALEMIADSGRMLSLEIVEVNPVLDERNRTARLGVELILSALGKDIL